MAKASQAIRQFQSHAVVALNQLKQHFDAPMKATLILRNPDNELCDVFVSEDETTEIEKFILRTKEREKTAKALK
jgi:hypothetical protein